MQQRTILILFMLLLASYLPVAGQQRYTHFPWTYDRNISAGIGAEGTAFTLLGRVRPDTVSAYSALAVPITPLRSAVGAYYHQHASLERQVVEYGIGYTLYFRFEEDASLRLGVQQNWHRVSDAAPDKTWNAAPTVRSTSTDFSMFLRRDHLLLGASVENALHKGARQYNMLLGFRELETYKWLRSSPFVMVQVYDGRELPEFKINYTLTALNTLTLGGSVYKNSYYRWGANAGVKLFRSLWLSAGADFKEYTLQPDALELGLRLNVGRGRIRSSSEKEALALPEEGL